jgi:hypothetical protein
MTINVTMRTNGDHPRLRRIYRDELPVGTVLPGHLRDRQGRILLRAGKRIELEHLTLLDERVDFAIFAADDWPTATPPSKDDAADPSDVLEALRLRRSSPGKARPRRHRRRACTVPVRLLIEERTALGSRQREADVTTCDISVAGFAFIFHQYMHPGTAVRATFASLPDRPHLTAIVRNCTHPGGAPAPRRSRIHKTGRTGRVAGDPGARRMAPPGLRPAGRPV